MIGALSLVLLAASLFGMLCLVTQLAFVVRHCKERRDPPPLPSDPEGISILKPLCGVDDELEANLAWFARLGYPRYEVVLGVKEASDPAYAVAQAAVARWPDIMRLELQQGEPGLNPKVNQLMTLAAAARYGILVISDSNVRVGPGYLEGIAQAFSDPQVGCVSHPVSGIGEQTLGSLMDNLYLCTTGGAGQIAAKRAAGKDIVVGKSMALRREDIESMGGFAAVKDVLAEDFVIGVWVTKKLKKRVVVADTPVYNVSQRRSVRGFFKRYSRWSIIHRTVITMPTYLGQSMMNPLPWAVLGTMVDPTPKSLALLGGVTVGKVLIDLTAFSLLRPERTPWKAAPAILLKDFLIFGAWMNALVNRTVDWRGTRLRVLPGSRLVAPSEPEPTPLPHLKSSDTESSEELLAG